MPPSSDYLALTKQNCDFVSGQHQERIAAREYCWLDVDWGATSTSSHPTTSIRGVLKLASILEGVLYQRLVLRADGQGRIPAVEVMLGTRPVRNLFWEGKTHQLFSAIQLRAAQGMQTLDQALQRLLDQRLITEETAVTYGLEPSHFRVGLTRALR